MSLQVVPSAQVIPITCWLNSFEFGQVLSSTSMSLFWFFFQVRVGRGSVVYHTSFNVYFVTAYMWLRSPHCLWQCCWGTYWPFVVFFQSPLSLSGIVIPKAVGWLKWIIMTRFGVLSWGHRWAIHASGSLMPMYSDSSSPSFVLLHIFWMGSSEFVYIE